MCIEKNLKLEMTIPIKLDKETKRLYNYLKEKGYDLFDIDNDFYTDICATYTAENKADILLDDRLYYFYRKIANIVTCPKDCKYSKYFIETNNLLCKCKVNDESIDTEKINEISVYIPEKSDYKYTSYKTMKCYKLVFNDEYFKKKVGSIILLIFIFFY